MGVIPSIFVIDEVHLLGLTPKGAQIFGQLNSGRAVREVSMGISISTAPVKGSPSGIFKHLYERSERILDGDPLAAGDSLMPTLFEMPADCDPEDKQYWWMANPSMNYTFPESFIHKEFARAKAEPDGVSLVNFYSQHLNLFVENFMGIDNFIQPVVWNAMADESITLKSLTAWEESVWVGLDKGGLDDLSAAVVLGRRGSVEDGTDEYQAWGRQWLDQQGYEKRKEVNKYDEWTKEENGELVVFQYQGEDRKAMMSLVENLEKSGKLIGVGVDKYHLTKEITIMKEDLGVTVMEVPQGGMCEPYIRSTHALLLHNDQDKFHHFGGKVLAWNFKNFKVEQKGAAMGMVKPQGIGVSPDKIDGAAALVFAIAVRDENPDDSIGFMLI